MTGERTTGDPGLHAGHRVTPVLEDLGDMLDLFGLGHRVQRTLRVLIGIKGAGVVLLHRLVQSMPGDVGVKRLQFLAELGDVLISNPLDCRELRLEFPALVRLACQGTAAGEIDATPDHNERDKNDQQEIHGPSLPRVDARPSP